MTADALRGLTAVQSVALTEVAALYLAETRYVLAEDRGGHTAETHAMIMRRREACALLTGGGVDG